MLLNNKWKKQITKNGESSFEWHVMAYSMSHIRYVIYVSLTEIQCRTFRDNNLRSISEFGLYDQAFIMEFRQAFVFVSGIDISVKAKTKIC